MHSVSITRDNWAQLVEDAGISLELLAVLTNVSYSTVYRYKNGSRNAQAVWLEKVGVILRDRQLRQDLATA